ncbi:MAG: terminase small subunit [Candidatus Korobacteraceae bacterium]|jgi:phage terminase small subunit
MKRPPSPRVAIFISEYLIDFNAARAAKAAGYQHPGSGRNLLRKVTVKQEIERRKAKRLDNLDITRERTLAELARCAYFDIRKLYRADGTLKPITELDSDTATIIQSVKVSRQKTSGGKGEPVVTEVVEEYKFTNRQGALDMLCKHQGLYEQIPTKSDNLTKLVEEQRIHNEINMAKYGGVAKSDIGDGSDSDNT